MENNKKVIKKLIFIKNNDISTVYYTTEKRKAFLIDKYTFYGWKLKK